MEATISVSKGVFLFPNGMNRAKAKKRKTDHSLFEKMYRKEIWYTTFKANWERLENELKDLQYKTYSMLLNDVVGFVKQSYEDVEPLEGVIPSATLLTGVSQPDHVSQFTALIDNIREEVTSHVALINSQDASTVKHLVENAVWQLIKGQDILDASIEDEVIQTKSKLKKNQCTMKMLAKWYKSKYSIDKQKTTSQVHKLVVIIPDFESFNCNVLQDFVMIVSSYTPELPVVLVYGVATSVSALHKSFPYHVSSKLLIKVFHSHSSPVYMNQVLENIFLTHNSPFHLSGKAFELLTDVFLFYDFSVTGLVQSIKYCMMEHFYGDNTKSMCCEQSNLEEAVMNLNSDDLESLRQMISFRPYLEKQDCKTKISLFEDDNFFREAVLQEMNKLHDYVHSFYLSVRVLAAIVKDMPKNNLGKTVREIYTKCATEHITNSSVFKECMQLLNFQSQLKLVDTIKNALKVVNNYLQDVLPEKALRSTPLKNNMGNVALDKELGVNFAKTLRVHLLTFLRQIENANTEATLMAHTSAEVEDDSENTPGNRYKLKEKLLKATRVDKIQSEYELVRGRFVCYVRESLGAGLCPPHARAWHEVVFFSDVARVRGHVVGAPRGALHTALNNPRHYLQCSCCSLPSCDSIVETLPDVSLAYKLHRECGKHINLYDWLQAFTQVLRPGDEHEHTEQDATHQLRFTRAVAELQFLGFIKSSKRKTDHVMRLTW